MNKKNKLIIYIYTGLLLTGGFMGYLKAGSLLSLIMAGSFSLVLLSLMFLSKKISKAISYTAFSFLLVDSFFTYRFLKTWKWMPSGLFCLFTFVCLIIFLKVSDPIQNKVRREP